MGRISVFCVARNVEIFPGLENISRQSIIHRQDMSATFVTNIAKLGMPLPAMCRSIIEMGDIALEQYQSL